MSLGIIIPSASGDEDALATAPRPPHRPAEQVQGRPGGQAQFKGGAAFWPGRSCGTQATYEILYKDGDRESNVHAALIRACRAGGAARARASSSLDGGVAAGELDPPHWTQPHDEVAWVESQGFSALALDHLRSAARRARSTIVR